MRCSASSWRTVPTRHGTHCPHDSSRKKAAMRSTRSRRSTVSSTTMTTPEPSVVPAARVSSCVSGMSSSSGRTNVPAAPPSSTACSVRPAPARRPSRSAPAASCRTALRRRRGTGRCRRGRTAACRSDCAVPIARERRAAIQDDVRHVRQRLDVVDHGRLAEEPGVHRERRLVARLAAPPFDRFEDRRLFAADVGAGAAADLDVETAPSRPAARRAVDRVLQARRRERVFAADVDEALSRIRSRMRRSSSLRRWRTDPPPSGRDP